MFEMASQTIQESEYAPRRSNMHDPSDRMCEYMVFG